MEESRLGEVGFKRRRGLCETCGFEVSEVHPGRDIKMVLKFRR